MAFATATTEAGLVATRTAFSALVVATRPGIAARGPCALTCTLGTTPLRTRTAAFTTAVVTRRTRLPLAALAIRTLGTRLIGTALATRSLRTIAATRSFERTRTALAVGARPISPRLMRPVLAAPFRTCFAERTIGPAFTIRTPVGAAERRSIAAAVRTALAARRGTASFGTPAFGAAMLVAMLAIGTAAVVGPNAVAGFAVTTAERALALRTLAMLPAAAGTIATRRCAARLPRRAIAFATLRTIWPIRACRTCWSITTRRVLGTLRPIATTAAGTTPGPVEPAFAATGLTLEFAPRHRRTLAVERLACLACALARLLVGDEALIVATILAVDHLAGQPLDIAQQMAFALIAEADRRA